MCQKECPWPDQGESGFSCHLLTAVTTLSVYLWILLIFDRLHFYSNLKVRETVL